MRKAAFGLVGTLMLAGCGESEKEPVRYVSEALMPMSGCAEAEAAIRQAAIQEMDMALDALRDSVLSTTDDDCGWEYSMEDSAPSAGSTQGKGSDGASQYSTTNNQIAGVDEPDFLKNDEKYLYVAVGSTFRIVEAWPAASAHEVASVTVEGAAKKLFVSGDRAVVYSSLGYEPSHDDYSYYYGSSECTYGYDCELTGDGRPTLITVFDIQDRAAPRRVRELRLSGSFVTGRRIGSAVHTVITSAGVSFPGLQLYLPVGLCGGGQAAWETLAQIEELRAKNRQLIETTPVSAWAPSVRDTVFENGVASSPVELMDQCGNFYKSGLNDGTALLTVLSFDMSGVEAASSATIVSRPGAAFASADSLYLAVPHQYNPYAGWVRDMTGQSEASTIHKFVLSNGTASAAYAASGTVKGKALNQFSMDENDGNLRIATTTHGPLNNAVTVLAQKGNELERVGSVENIATGEDIRSVRFQGDRGFVVTFKKTDPLFVLDLAEPTDPKLLGELIIPGFSTYMHMMDPTHLMTIGYDGDEQGSFAWFAGVSLQIFDVSNPSNPVRIHHEAIGTRGSSSEALTNHLAFNFFAPIHMLALPMTVCEGGSGGGYGSTMSFSGLMVYDTTVENGFVLKGKVAHPTSTSGTGYYDSAGCQSWWTHATTEVKRSVFMDEYVYSVSEKRIKVNALQDLGTDVQEIVF